MFSFIVARACMAATFALERPLARLEAAFALWAGEKKGAQRQVVVLEMAVDGPEFRDIVQSKNLLAAMARAEVMNDMGAVPRCGCCGGVAHAA